MWERPDRDQNLELLVLELLVLKENLLVLELLVLENLVLKENLLNLLVLKENLLNLLVLKENLLVLKNLDHSPLPPSQPPGRRSCVARLYPVTRWIAPLLLLMHLISDSPHLIFFFSQLQVYPVDHSQQKICWS